MRTPGLGFLLAVALSCHTAHGEFTLTVDVVRCRDGVNDQQMEREEVASVSVVARLDDKFSTVSRVGDETIKLSGVVREANDGNFDIVATPYWSRRIAEGEKTVAMISVKKRFDSKRTVPTKAESPNSDRAAIESNRIRFESEQANGNSDEVRQRWLGDELVVSGLGRTVVQGGGHERMYFYVRLKESNY